MKSLSAITLSAGFSSAAFMRGLKGKLSAYTDSIAASIFVTVLNTTDDFESTQVNCIQRDPVASARAWRAAFQLCSPSAADVNESTIESQCSSFLTMNPSLASAKRAEF